MIPEIQIPSIVITILQLVLAFGGAFFIALWLSLIVWTFRDARQRSRDIFAILLATLMVVVFGPLGLVLYFLLRPPNTLAELYERSLEEEALLQDLEERPRCPGCSRQVKEAWLICPDCHTKLKKTCPSCENSLELHWNLCPFCTLAVETPTIGGDHPPPSQQPTTPQRPVTAAQASQQAAQKEVPDTVPAPFPGNEETRPYFRKSSQGVS